jgi:hypothetical protein
VARDIESLTAMLEASEYAPGSFSKDFAAEQLGRIGVDYDLPPRTIDALKATLNSDGMCYYNPNIPGVGSGELRMRYSDGARTAFLMWELRDIESPAEKAAFLWRKFSEPQCGDCVAMFCIDSLLQIEDPVVVPFLAAAAACQHEDAGWYVRNKATRRLADFLPLSKDVLLLLRCSADAAVATIAREASIPQREVGKRQAQLEENENEAFGASERALQKTADKVRAKKEKSRN